MKMRLTIAALLLIGSAVSAHAASTPEEVVTVYFQDFQRGDMQALAASMHPDELTKFRDMMLPVIEKGIAATEENPDAEDPMAMKVFAGINDMEAIRTENAEAFFARFMNWVMTINPMMKSSMDGAKVETIGHVDEGDVTHVVFRMQVEMMGTTVKQISAISLKKSDDTWKLMLTGEVEGMSKLLQANLLQLE